MPITRLFDNATLSLLTKLSSGYWDLYDPTNWYAVIQSSVTRLLPFKKTSRRYFFKVGILFRLNIKRAVVFDILMNANYSNEVSGLKISRMIFDFLLKYLRNFSKHIFLWLLLNWYVTSINRVTFRTSAINFRYYFWLLELDDICKRWNLFSWWYCYVISAACLDGHAIFASFSRLWYFIYTAQA